MARCPHAGEDTTVRVAILLVFAAVACGSSPAPMQPVVVAETPPVAPAPSSIAAAPVAQPTPVVVAKEPDYFPLDLDHARRVSIKSTLAKSEAPRPIGTRPIKVRLLREVSKVKDASALERAESGTTYDPKRPFELRTAASELPKGARPDIPLTFEGALTVISESGGKLLLVYAGRFVAVVDGKNVEEVVDFEPPELPLSEEDRLFDEVHQVVYEDGVLFACRGYNAKGGKTGIVTAIDAATGELRWRSPQKVCGGVLTLVADYVLTGYGAHDTPYALKLLRRYDGAVVQTLPLFGAALEFEVSGPTVVASTYKHRVEYQLVP